MSPSSLAPSQEELDILDHKFQLWAEQVDRLRASIAPTPSRPEEEEEEDKDKDEDSEDEDMLVPLADLTRKRLRTRAQIRQYIAMQSRQRQQRLFADILE